VPERQYPANPARAALSLFSAWLGSHYARSTALESLQESSGLLAATLRVGRRWPLAVTVANTFAGEETAEFASARAAIERRLDAEGRSLALWCPRGAPLPAGEPGLSQLMLAVESARALPGGRLEVRRPVSLFLRRTSREGSVITILGGLSAHWAQFTGRVPGSFQLNSLQLYRLPASEEERSELAERIVLAAGQPEVDESVTIPAEDAWTANDLGEGGSCVLGSPIPDTDESSAALRRTVRQLLREASPLLAEPAGARALVLLGAATYAEEERLSWIVRGMDPSLYAGYDIIAVVADGLVRPLLQPARQTLPWDAPPGR
jgi:hypothetical protein